MVGMRAVGISVAGSLGMVLLLAGCAATIPPWESHPQIPGCYELHTNLPEIYEDSLEYRLPPAIRLGVREAKVERGPLHPGEHPEYFRMYYPFWTNIDRLASGWVRRARVWKPIIHYVPGDSIDLAFPCFYGELAFRVSWSGNELHGRAEWLSRGRAEPNMNEGVHVILRPTSCDRVPRRLLPLREPFPGRW